MSQQSEFEYSKQPVYEQQTINQDPREQYQGYRADEIAARNMSDQKIYPVQPRRRRRRGLRVLIIIVVILFALGGLSYLNSTVFGKTTTLEPRTFNVSGTPTLVVNNSVGHVTFHKGDGNSVIVKATEHTGLVGNVQVDMTQSKDGSELDINANTNGMTFGNVGVDLDITLPATSNIRASEDAGQIDINGISGLMNIKTDAGTINFQGGTIADGSTFNDDAGTINFAGSLATGGTYDFENNAGAINLTLPTDSSFILDAKTDVGHIDNQFGGNSVGSNPASQLHVHTDAGSIHIDKQ